MSGDTTNCLIFLAVVVLFGVVLVWFRRSGIGYGKAQSGPGTTLDDKIEDLNADQRMLRGAELSRQEKANARLQRELEELEKNEREKKERGF